MAHVLIFRVDNGFLEPLMQNECLAKNLDSEASYKMGGLD